jgi:site-specific recombinase XerD
MKAGSAWAHTGFIFTNEIGQPLRGASVDRIFKAVLADAKLDNYPLKVTRHSCASAMLNSGKSLKVIQERLGHSSIQITSDVYSVVEKRLQNEASEAIEEVFGFGKKR